MLLIEWELTYRMVKTALELARDTIDILNEKGWHKGPSRMGETNLCLGEAIGTAAVKANNKDDEENRKQIEQVEKLRLTIQSVIRVPGGADWVGIIEWNDAVERRKQDVMEVLNKSIDILIPAVS